MPEIEFSFDEEIVQLLTNGDCWELATILHQRTGYPFAALYGDGEIVHVGVERADGTVIDIEGVWEFYEWERRWIDELEHIWDISCAPVSDNDPEYGPSLTYSTTMENTLFGDKSLSTIADEIIAVLKRNPAKF